MPRQEALSAPTPPPDDFEAEGEKRAVRKKMHPLPYKRKAGINITDRSWKKARHEMLEKAQSGDWANTKPLHLLVLHCELFNKIYKFEALDTYGKMRTHAVFAVANLLKTAFNGDVEKIVAYVKWVWTREEEREEYRKANGKGGQTLGWKLVFSHHLLNDFANDLRRKAAR